MTEDLSQRIADLERERDLLAARVEAYQVSLDVIRDQRAALLARVTVYDLEHKED